MPTHTSGSGEEMDVKDAQDMMRRIYLERDKERGVHRTLLRTFQELAELSEAILKEKDEAAISDEMADVFAWICSLANLLDVDLADALFAKYSDVCSRCKKAPCVCQDIR
jgi:NTP pyrophosphatase (non-canonical NTP hydrolase)